MTDTPMIETTINGRWTLKLPEHRAHRAEWSNPGWEPERLASMAANIKPGDVVFDVGTEEGDLSALYAQWVIEEAVDYSGGFPQPAGRAPEQHGGVVLIEPNPRVWPNIRAIFEANNLPDPLDCWVGFAGAEDTGASPDWFNAYVGISENTDWPLCAFGDVIGDHGFLNLSERPDVPVITIDTLSAEHGCDAITVDVEGAELAVMRGAEHTLREHRPFVWISVHPEFGFDMYGVYEADLHGFMHSCGYVKRWLAHDHETHYAYVASERVHEFVLQERADWT